MACTPAVAEVISTEPLYEYKTTPYETCSKSSGFDLGSALVWGAIVNNLTDAHGAGTAAGLIGGLNGGNRCTTHYRTEKVQVGYRLLVNEYGRSVWRNVYFH